MIKPKSVIRGCVIACVSTADSNLAFKHYLCSLRRRLPQPTISTPRLPPPGCLGIILDAKWIENSESLENILKMYIFLN